MNDMTVEKAIGIIKGMEQMECCCPACERRRPALQFALVALDQLRWRNTEKEPPEHGERVLATDGDFVGEMYLNDIEEWVRDNWFWRINMHTKIIAWLPIPTPPEVK